MPKLYAVLIRHGEYHQQENAPSAHQPHPLTENGIAQAETTGSLMAKWLEEEGWTLASQLHCSVLLRAWQTADSIHRQLAHANHFSEIIQTEALCERSVGALANLDAKTIKCIVANDPRYEALPKGWKSHPDFRLPVPGAESLDEAGLRVATHVRQVMQEQADAGAAHMMQLFVGHGAVFRHAARHLGVLSADDIPRLSMFHAGAVCLCWDSDTNTWSHYRGEWKRRESVDRFTD